MSEPASPRSAPLALWRAARAFLETLFVTFGGPAAIAAQHAFGARTHALISAWLSAGEAMLRQLLLIEAAALAPAGAYATPTPAPRTTRHVAFKQVAPLLDNPESWRVSFRCFAAESGAGGGGGWRERKAAHSVHAAFPIAARMEAMLRVFNDPAPFAQRLVRRLLRRPRRARDLLRKPKPSPHAPRACAEIEGLAPAAEKARAVLDTS